jgi:hypothetical protein
MALSAAKSRRSKFIAETFRRKRQGCRCGTWPRAVRQFGGSVGLWSERATERDAQCGALVSAGPTEEQGSWLSWRLSSVGC